MKCQETRAYRIKKKQFVYFPEHLDYSCFDGGRSEFSEHMKNSGKEDRKGVEIFEGDIVKDNKKPANIGLVIREKEDGTFRIEWRMPHGEGLSIDDYFNVTIIGNKYQSPELLVDIKE